MSGPGRQSNRPRLGGEHRRAKNRYNDKEKVREHYDRVSPYYRTLWGEHLHHGYWIRGDETKEEAQIQLIEHVAHVAGIRTGMEILDVGCGFGGSSIYLAKKFGARATGITTSKIQVEMAQKSAAAEKADAKFVLMDAEEMRFEKSFDVVWSVESISHYPEKENFFDSAAQCLGSGGTVTITDWFKKEDLTPAEHRKFIEPIEKGMLVKLDTMEDYRESMRRHCLQIICSEILSKNCAKTWELCLDIIKNKALWRMAAEYGPEFVDYLRAFQAMRAGFESGNFIYGLIVAKKV